MESFEVTQALLSVGTQYQVVRRRSEDVLYAIRGELMSTTPRFKLTPAGAGEGAVAELSANFLKTRYDVVEGDKTVASLSFPAVALKKTVTLTVGSQAYQADGGVFRGIFRFRPVRDDASDPVFEITKELSIRDTFLVSTTGALPLSVVLLSAVAIHSRFYEMV